MEKREKTYRFRIKEGFAVSVLWILCGMAFAYRLSYPPEVEKLPEAERVKWLNEQLDTAKVEQNKVAQERYDARLNEKIAVIEDMKAEAEKRRNLIQSARVASEKREKEAVAQSKIVYGLSLFILIPSIGMYVYFKRRSRAL